MAGFNSDDGGELELDWKGRTPPEKRGEASGSALTAPTEGGTLQTATPGRGIPGDPKGMSAELRMLLEPMLSGPGLRVRQQKEWGEILTGWEAANRYEVCDLTGRPVVYAGETGKGLMAVLLRNFWSFHTIRIEFMTLSGVRALTLTRPWRLFFSRADVEAWDGRKLGVIQQRFSIIRRSFDILTAAGGLLANIEGPIWRPWTFYVKKDGVELAVIKKQWSGLGQELFTDADTFGVEFRPACTDGRLRQLVLAATLMIDLLYFENRNRKNNGSGLLGLLSS
jgi:uncharacterized protein YxjI